MKVTRIPPEDPASVRLRDYPPSEPRYPSNHLGEYDRNDPRAGKHGVKVPAQGRRPAPITDRCPNPACGFLNEHGTVECQICGYPLTEEE